jgi:hypothetical protein
MSLARAGRLTGGSISNESTTSPGSPDARNSSASAPAVRHRDRIDADGGLADDRRAGGGALYRLDRDGRTELVLGGLTISKRARLESRRQHVLRVRRPGLRRLSGSI